MTTDTEQDFIFIDSAEDLATYCASITDCEWLALDTEFLRERTYYPKLCLLQIATDQGIACIDPLALDDLSVLMGLIYDPQKLKIFHAARQDLEIFLYLQDALPGPVFDTQLAAALLTDNEQIGYANLVEQLIGVSLKKDHTRTDWTRRPLNAGQLQYAADDVRYLYAMYEQQRAQLQAQNKLDWLEDDFAALLDPGTYQQDPQTLWTRVKQHRKLKGQQLAVLRELAAWREQRAERLNRPRKWIIKDEPLLDISRFMPDNQQQLGKIRDIEAGHLKNIGDELLACVARGKAVEAEHWPSLNKITRLTPEQDALLDFLTTVVRLRAQEREISPTTLATRKMLEQFLLDPDNNPLCRGWRKTVVGKTLQAALRGEIQLRVEGQGLVLETRTDVAHH